MKTYNILEDNVTYSIKEDYNGTKHWYLNGKFHRVNGPAVECTNGGKWWYLNNQRHRINGPAIEYADGSKQWFLNDNFHRVGGPAVELANGTKYWYFHGTEILCKNLKEFTKQIKLLSIS